MQDTFDLPKLSLGYAGVILLAALWIYQGGQAGKIIWRPTPLDVPLFSFILATFLSACLSIEPALSFFGVYRIYVFGFFPLLSFALLYGLVAQVRSPTIIHRVKIAILGSAAAVSLYALLQYFGWEIFNAMPKAPGGRIWSSLGNPLYMGAVCMMAWPLALQDLWECWQRPKGLGRVLISFLALGLISTALALSLSRGAWLGTGVALALMAASWYKQSVHDPGGRRRMWKAILVPVGMAALLWWSFPVQSEAARTFWSRRKKDRMRPGWKDGKSVWRWVESTHGWDRAPTHSGERSGRIGRWPILGKPART